MKNNTDWTGTNQDPGILSTPLSFLRSGSFYWNNAGLNNRGGYGSYWSLRSGSTTSSNYLDFGNTYLNPQVGSNRGYGFAVRCVSNPSPLSLILAIL